MQGRIVRSPEVWNKEQDNRPGIFLAGGITGCPDWQEPVAEKLANVLPVVVLDPRRTEWDLDSHIDGVLQIAWECKHLKKAEQILFWFPRESVCPIALFELGAHLGRDVGLIVGTDPDYSRRLDIEVQMSLVRPTARLWCKLDEMVEHIIGHFPTKAL